VTTENTGEVPGEAPVLPARAPLLDAPAEIEIEVDVDIEFDIDLVDGAAAKLENLRRAARAPEAADTSAVASCGLRQGLAATVVGGGDDPLPGVTPALFSGIQRAWQFAVFNGKDACAGEWPVPLVGG
jgi:hypothetical protein